MKKNRFPLIIVLVAFLQCSVSNYFRLLDAKADLLIICCIIAALRFDLIFSLLMALLAGFLKDFLGAGGFGVNTIFFPFFSLLVFILNRNIPVENSLTFTALNFLAVLLNNIFTKSILSASGISFSFAVFMRIAFLSAFITAAISLLVFIRWKEILFAGNSIEAHS